MKPGGRRRYARFFLALGRNKAQVITMMKQTQPSVLSVSLACRCPRCGQGPLFQQLLKLREQCSNCGMNYGFIDTGDGPAVFVIFLLGALILGGALYLEFTYSPPVWVHVVVWGVLTSLIAIVLLRFMKALLIALQYKHKAEEGRLDDGA